MAPRQNVGLVLMMGYVIMAMSTPIRGVRMLAVIMRIGFGVVWLGFERMQCSNKAAPLDP
jgi:hypothetical protein